MSTAAQIAAQRLNAARAGLTGTSSQPSQEPGAPKAASPVEVIQHLVPTEFGGLTHLFGGENSPAQFEPVNTAKAIPAGSVPGKLGGLAPDVRNTATHAVATARKSAEPTVTSLSSAARNTLARARELLKI